MLSTTPRTKAQWNIEDYSSNTQESIGLLNEEEKSYGIARIIVFTMIVILLSALVSLQLVLKCGKIFN